MAVEEPLPSGEVRRQRLNSSDRRAGILSAASRVFERRRNLLRSVVEPLHLPIDAFLRRAQPPAVPMTRAERLTFMSTVLSDMVDQLAENLPALGLVLFGSPGIITGTDPVFTAGVDFKERDPSFDPRQRPFTVNPARGPARHPDPVRLRRQRSLHFRRP